MSQLHLSRMTQLFEVASSAGVRTWASSFGWQVLVGWSTSVMLAMITTSSKCRELSSTRLSRASFSMRANAGNWCCRLASPGWKCAHYFPTEKCISTCTCLVSTYILGLHLTSLFLWRTERFCLHLSWMPVTSFEESSRKQTTPTSLLCMNVTLTLYDCILLSAEFLVRWHIFHRLGHKIHARGEVHAKDARIDTGMVVTVEVLT